jgi:imidazolonepropionase-like amidohydrolase
MVDAGLTAREGIAAATEGGARALGLDDVGVLAPGKAADVVVVSSDPLADVRALTRPEEVWLVLKSGRPVAGQALVPELRSEAAGSSA